jgi:hypothetical protein
MMISLMQGWLFIAFLVMMFPASMFMDIKGKNVWTFRLVN